MTDLLSSYAWIVWIVLILLFVIVEVVTVEFTFLMLAIGSVGGLLAGLFGAPFWLQILVAAVLALLLLFTVRPPMLRALKRGGDSAKTGLDALLGLAGTVIIPVRAGEPGQAPGQVKLTNGETWSARLLAPQGTDVLDTGSPVVVTAIEGSTAVVVPSGTTVPTQKEA